jgi:hypothetical protein
MHRHDRHATCCLALTMPGPDNALPSLQLNCREGLPEQVTPEMLEDEEFLKHFHHALLEVGCCMSEALPVKTHGCSKAGAYSGDACIPVFPAHDNSITPDMCQLRQHAVKLAATEEPGASRQILHVQVPHMHAPSQHPHSTCRAHAERCAQTSTDIVVIHNTPP